MHETKIQIRFSDCDMLAHVNNAIYLQYFEYARIDFFNHYLSDWDWQSKGLILAKNTVEYKIPLFLNDNCLIELGCKHIGNSNFTLFYNVVVIENGKRIIKSIGESILVCFDFKEKSSYPIPPELNSVLEKKLV